ncbi:MAG: hypothetical protein E6J91_39735 [Deltaproteobacteria bacterium]|nr:MAG: hypothetical protein E6J91_39735 [Deltaproteobacteria bacterium]
MGRTPRSRCGCRPSPAAWSASRSTARPASSLRPALVVSRCGSRPGPRPPRSRGNLGHRRRISGAAPANSDRLCRRADRRRGGMLRAMFGMGGTEILVILIVALLFLGPDKLPDAAKKISKGIRDIKKQSRALQRTIEDDEHIGGAIRDLRSALRGEDEPYRPKPRKQLDEPTADTPAIGTAAAALAAATEPPAEADAGALDTALEGASDAHTATHAEAPAAAPHAEAAHEANGEHADAPRLTLPPTAGEAEPSNDTTAHGDADLAALVKPAPNTIARGAAPAGPAPAGPADTEPKHG